jgi:hypothetical protein
MKCLHLQGTQKTCRSWTSACDGSPTLINTLVLQNAEHFRNSRKLLAFQEVTCALQLHIYDLIALTVHSRGTHLSISLKYLQNPGPLELTPNRFSAIITSTYLSWKDGHVIAGLLTQTFYRHLRSSRMLRRVDW